MANKHRNASREEISQDISSLVAEKSVIEREVEATREELGYNRKVIEEELQKGKSDIEVIRTNIATLENRREGLREEIKNLGGHVLDCVNEIKEREDSLALLKSNIDIADKELIKTRSKIDQAEGKLASTIAQEKLTKEAYEKIDELTQELVSKKNVLFGELKLMQNELEIAKAEAGDLRQEAVNASVVAENDTHRANELLDIATAAIKDIDAREKELAARTQTAIEVEARATEKLSKAVSMGEGLATREKLVYDKENALNGKEQELEIREGKIKQAIRINKLKESGIL